MLLLMVEKPIKLVLRVLIDVFKTQKKSLSVVTTNARVFTFSAREIWLGNAGSEKWSFMIP